MSVAYGEIIEFPAFLSRPREDAMPPAEAGVWLRLVRRVGDWGLGMLERPMRAWAVHRVKRAEAAALIKLNELERELQMVQEIPSVGRQARGTVSTPVAVDAPDTRLLQDAKAALDAFREVEGERMLNNLLQQMLANSSARLARHNIKAPGGDEAARVARLEEANKQGGFAYQKLLAAGNELRVTAIHKGDERDLDAATKAAEAWDELTGS